MSIREVSRTLKARAIRDVGDEVEHIHAEHPERLPFGSLVRFAVVDELVTNGPYTIPVISAAYAYIEAQATLVEACHIAVIEREDNR